MSVTWIWFVGPLIKIVVPYLCTLLKSLLLCHFSNFFRTPFNFISILWWISDSVVSTCLWEWRVVLCGSGAWEAARFIDRDEHLCLRVRVTLGWAVRSLYWVELWVLRNMSRLNMTYLVNESRFLTLILSIY